MRRREFIALLGGGAAGWSLAARAQQSGKLPTIGFLGTDAATWNQWKAAFVQRLSELGWNERRTVTIEYRWDEGRSELDSEFASEFVRLKVDVIVANGVGAVILKQTTQVIPLVFLLAQDPVGSGLVDSLSRPGGNVTGVTTQAVDLVGKRVELLREVVPDLRRLAILVNVAFPQAVLEMHRVKATALTLGVEVITPLEIQRAADISPAFAALHGEADALYVVAEPLTGANRTRIISLALGARFPTMFNTRDYARAGGLISYGPSYEALFRRGADFVDKILRGTKPSDIPVEQPTKFELVVNLTTAQAIGLAVPPTLLARADEVIE
jgi:putative ABC transport system substrate-binding protein